MYRKYQNIISVVCLTLILIVAVCAAIMAKTTEEDDVRQIIEPVIETETETETEIVDTTISEVTTSEESHTKKHNVVNNAEDKTTTYKNEIEIVEPVNTTETRSETTTSETTIVETVVDKSETTDNITTTTTDSNVDTSYLGEFRLTAYCNCSTCCGVWAGGATASGKMPREGRTIAVDTSVIPLGAAVEINGHTYIAEDTGSAIKGNRIDIYFDSHQTASDFGVQYADVYRVY